MKRKWVLLLLIGLLCLEMLRVVLTLTLGNYNLWDLILTVGMVALLGIVFYYILSVDIHEKRVSFDQYDLLTGLANRKKLELMLSETVASLKDKQFALLFIDLDRFQFVNDTAGHGIGDLLLKDFANRLKKRLLLDEIAARHGGDEFAITFCYSNVKELETRINDLLKTLSNPFQIGGQDYLLTCSIGISLLPQDARTVEEWIKNTDIALYTAKEVGNRYCYFKPEMNKIIFQKHELERGMRKALENDEFELYYQPQVNLQTGEFIGAEALIRWHHPERGLVSPAEFIPLAEETGWIVPIGEWVLKTACKQNKLWQKAGFDPIRIAVNVSAKQFEHKDFADQVFRILKESHLQPGYLELEMTESILQNYENVEECISRLKSSGVQLSIDDFGTGYSSLSYLRRFPIDTLKIDRSFVHDSLNDEKGIAIVRAMIAMAASLKMEIIAEGIETDEQERSLRRENCFGGQGFLFSPPLPADEFKLMLEEGIKMKV